MKMIHDSTNHQYIVVFDDHLLTDPTHSCCYLVTKCNDVNNIWNENSSTIEKFDEIGGGTTTNRKIVISSQEICSLTVKSLSTEC